MSRYDPVVICFVFGCFFCGVIDAGLGETTTKAAPSSDCTGEQFKCPDGTCIPLEQRCNFFQDCPDFIESPQADEAGCLEISCSFENGNYCGWSVHADAGGFTWNDTQAKDKPVEKSPPADHTMGDESGWYLLAKSGESQEAETWLYPEIPLGRTSDSCKLKFWYWLAGDSPGSLHLVKTDEKGESHEIWMADGNQGEEWQSDVASIGNMLNQNLTVNARRGEAYSGVGALDDFMFLDCETPFYPPANKTCKDFEQFQCKDGMCALQSAICDYAWDCPDISDENPVTCLNYKFSCDFEIGFCNDWQQDTDDTTNWIRLQASAEVEGTSPETDHTELTGDGHYILLNTAPVVEYVTAVGRISSPVLLDSSMECALRLWYQFTGEESGTLKIYARVSYYEDGLIEVIKRTLPKNVWIKETVTFSPYVGGKNYRVVIEGTNDKFGKGNLVIDDLSMTPSCEVSDDQTLPGQDTISTPVPVCPPGQLTCNSGECYYPSDRCNFKNDCSDGTDEQGCAKNCDFETEGDLCGWYENSGSSVHWAVRGFPAEEPGPAADHKGDSSTHALSISLQTGGKGREAVLQSDTYSGVSKNCVLEAWYYVASDANDSSLSLYIQDEQVSRHIFEAGVKSQWDLMSVSISSEMNFLLYFQATMGGNKAYTALDDINFKNCSTETKKCTSTEFQCIDEENCVPYYVVCDGKYDCHDKTDEESCNLKRNQGDCDFDHGDWLLLCEWEQSEDDDINWNRANRTNATIVGPSEDHTFGDGGYYIYVGDSAEPGVIAAIGPVFMYPPSNLICYIRFWYYLSDTSEGDFNLGALRVFLQDESGVRSLVSSHTARRPPEWQEDILPLSSDKNFTVVFEAETGDPEHTYIALDDVSFTRECVTGVPPPNSTCLPQEFECGDSQCIPQRLHCNFFNDCKDGSDEIDCPDPPPTCKETEFNCGDTDKTCLPAALLCDGVDDCPGSSDEKNCPDGTPCNPGSIYCGDPDLNPPCLVAKYMCDKNVSCRSYQADESLCGVCPENLCLNKAECVVEENNAPSCRCVDDYKGNRCEIEPDGGLSAGEITGIVVGCLAFVVLVAVISYYYIQKTRTSNSPGYILSQLK